MPHDDVLVVQIRTPDFSFVLATRGEHASGRSIVGTSDHLANEAELPHGDHILDTRYVVKHLANLLISYLSFLNVSHREVEDPSNILMEKTSS